MTLAVISTCDTLFALAAACACFLPSSVAKTLFTPGCLGLLVFKARSESGSLGLLTDQLLLVPTVRGLLTKQADRES